MDKWIFRIIGFFSFLMLAVFLLVVTSIVPELSDKNAQVVSGEVTRIYESGTNDISFLLNTSDKVFYINRGLEQGLNIDDLREQLMHKEISLTYPKHWAPLNWDGSIVHVSILALGDELIYDERQG